MIFFSTINYDSEFTHGEARIKTEVQISAEVEQVVEGKRFWDDDRSNCRVLGSVFQMENHQLSTIGETMYGLG